jgi:hypothetical protein
LQPEPHLVEVTQRAPRPSHLLPHRKSTVDLDDIAAAHRLADTGRKRGNVVVRIPHTHHPEGAPVMIEAHALTQRYGDTTALDTGDHAGAGGGPVPHTRLGAAIFGAGNLPTALLVGAAWAINLAVAERQIRKRPRRGTPAAPVQVPLP